MTAIGGDGSTEPATSELAVGPGSGFRRGWIVLVVLAVVLVVGVVFAFRLSAGAPSERAMLGKPAPTVALTTLAGEPVSSADFMGRPIIVNFWNTWCEPCLQEAPALEQFAELVATRDTDVALLAIVRDEDDTNAVREYVERNGVEWTVLLDPKQAAALGYGTRGQPETYAISPSGVVVGAQYGPVSVEDLDLMLRAAQAAG